MSELEDFKSRVEILEAAVDLLEERLSRLMDIQTIEPYEIELSEEDAEKLRDWIYNERN